MIIFYFAGIITTAVVSVWITAVVGVAIKNQLVQRQVRQLRYWQDRAVQAETRLRAWQRADAPTNWWDRS
jgi:hypothetical protein